MFNVETFDDATSYASSAETAALFIISTKKELKVLEIDSHPLIDEALQIKFGNKRIYKSTAGEANEYIIASHDSIIKKSDGKNPSLNEFEKKFLDNYGEALKNGFYWGFQKRFEYLMEQQQLLHISRVFYELKNARNR